MTYRFLISLICWLSSSFFVCCNPATVVADQYHSPENNYIGPLNNGEAKSKAVDFEKAYPEFKLIGKPVIVDGEERLVFDSENAKKLLKLKHAYVLLREEYLVQEKALASAEELVALQKRLAKIMEEIRDAEKELIEVHKERQKLCAEEKKDLKKRVFRERVKSILITIAAVAFAAKS